MPDERQRTYRKAEPDAGSPARMKPAAGTSEPSRPAPGPVTVYRPRHAPQSPGGEPSRPRMIRELPAKYVESRPSLIYYMVRESEPSQAVARIGQSRTYRAKAFSCGFFYKPVSRYLVEWRP